MRKIHIRKLALVSAVRLYVAIGSPGSPLHTSLLHFNAYIRARCSRCYMERLHLHRWWGRRRKAGCGWWPFNGYHFIIRLPDIFAIITIISPSQVYCQPVACLNLLLCQSSRCRVRSVLASQGTNSPRQWSSRHLGSSGEQRRLPVSSSSFRLRLLQGSAAAPAASPPAPATATSHPDQV